MKEKEREKKSQNNNNKAVPTVARLAACSCTAMNGPSVASGVVWFWPHERTFQDNGVYAGVGLGWIVLDCVGLGWVG